MTHESHNGIIIHEGITIGASGPQFMFLLDPPTQHGFPVGGGHKDKHINAVEQLLIRPAKCVVYESPPNTVAVFFGLKPVDRIDEILRSLRSRTNAPALEDHKLAAGLGDWPVFIWDAIIVRLVETRQGDGFAAHECI